MKNEKNPYGKKPPNSTWTRKREKELVNLYNKGISYKEIAKHFDVFDSAVRQKVERMGLLYVKRVGDTPLESFVDELMEERGIK